MEQWRSTADASLRGLQCGTAGCARAPQRSDHGVRSRHDLIPASTRELLGEDPCALNHPRGKVLEHRSDALRWPGDGDGGDGDAPPVGAVEEDGSRYGR